MNEYLGRAQKLKSSMLNYMKGHLCVCLGLNPDLVEMNQIFVSNELKLVFIFSEFVV